MITERELQISNKSYTNKDFQDIYPEILSIANKLSERWKPQSSNESDPGIVLLKLLGFMGDKLNYNIDKNVLECFLPSATQMSSVRNLCELGGYSPRYYQSAKTDISILYQGSQLGEKDSFSLKPFETIFKDADDTKHYVLLETITVSKNTHTESAPVIEGELIELTVAGVSKITPEFLDDNNRIYFPEQMVAENGIFVREYVDSGLNTSELWSQVSNLNTVAPGNTCYKFGYDSIQQLPYIEFPKDIFELIGEGLSIKYIRTTGSQGNISAGFLTQLASPGEIYSSGGVKIYPEQGDSSEDKVVLVISNQSSTVTGKDPETIDEAYNSFKKTVGTFDTLVTCRDYANYIYNLVDNEGNTVSNIQVTDRRTDYNYANRIVTFTEQGQAVNNKPDLEKITPFDLCLYPLRPINTLYNSETYINSFSPLPNTSYIESSVEGTQSISHNFKQLSDNDIFAFKAMYKLNIKIVTKYKVNTYEQMEIKQNVRDALYKNFNSRELDYGYEIPYDSLVRVIESADPRIKTIILDEPDVFIKGMKTDGTELDIKEPTNNVAVDYIAKNVLAGRISLFEFDTNFDYMFNQKTNSTGIDFTGDTDRDYQRSNIMSVTTECEFEVGANGSTDYTLRENEVLLAAANLYTSPETFGSYAYFKYKGSDISANTNHTLAPGEELVVAIESSPYYKLIRFTNTQKITTSYLNGEWVGTSTDDITGGVIIKPSFILKETYPSTDRYYKNDVLEKSDSFPAGIKESLVGPKNEDGSYANPIYMLTIDEQIERRSPVFITLKKPSTPCYWMRNTENNSLFIPSEFKEVGNNYEVSTILGEGEAFIYSDSTLNAAEILGSGTKVTLTVPKTKVTPSIDEYILKYWSIIDDTVSLEEFNSNGLAAFGSVNWRYQPFEDTPGNSTFLRLDRMQILTLANGDSFHISNGGDGFTINNSWKNFTLSDTNSFSYTIVGGEVENPDDMLERGLSWQLRSRLDLNCGVSYGQLFKSNHKLTIKYNDNDHASVTNNTNNHITVITGSDDDEDGYSTYFTFNTLVQTSGGENIKFSVIDLERSTPRDKVYQFPFKFYTYKQAPITFTNVHGGTEEFTANEDGYIQVPLNILGGNLSLKMIAPKGVVSMIMFYNNGIGNDGILLSMSGCKFNTIQGIIDGSSLNNSGTKLSLNPGINIIGYIPDSSNEVTLTISPEDGYHFKDFDNGHNLIVGNICNASTNIATIGNVSWPIAKQFKTLEVSPKLVDIMHKIIELDAGQKFYWNAPLDELSLIDTTDMLSPEAFFDYNNVANNMTICQLIIPGDVGSSDSTMEIVRTSRA